MNPVGAVVIYKPWALNCNPGPLFFQTRIMSSTIIVADLATPVADYFFFVKIVGCKYALCNICQPCGGCELFNHIGFELDLL